MDAAVGLVGNGPMLSLARSLLKLRNMARPRLPSSWKQLHTDERRHHHALRQVRSAVRTNGALPPQESAKAMGLRYVSDRDQGIRRLGRPKRFRYVATTGRRLSSDVDLMRIRSLAIPPAWTDVWICVDPAGHL